MTFVFSRKAWTSAMKNKTSASTVQAFEQVFNRADGRRPDKVQTDDGKEFTGAPFKRFLRENGIVWFSTNMIMIASVTSPVIYI